MALSFDDITVPYYPQLSDYNCGGACAQMVLEKNGAGLLDQDSLQAYSHSENLLDPTTGWATAPDGLTTTLNHFMPAGFAETYALAALTTEDAISRKLVWTIHQHRIPAVALVYGWIHWIVVHGYTATANPTSSSDPSYSIATFFVNDPAPPSPCSPSTMGNISILDWRNTYMKPVPADYWQGKYVAVTDSDPPLAVRPGQPRAFSHRCNGERILTIAEAQELSLAALKENGLGEHSLWRDSLVNTTPGRPLLVQRLDRLDSFYYITPLHTNNELAPGLVCIDARFGNYLRSSVSLNPRRSAAAHLHGDRSALLSAALQKPIDLGKRQGRLIVRNEAYAIYPTLVWRPCRESLSPYFPFLMVVVGNRRLYIRVDGKTFPRLHIRDRGI